MGSDQSNLRSSRWFLAKVSYLVGNPNWIVRSHPQELPQSKIASKPASRLSGLLSFQLKADRLVTTQKLPLRLGALESGDAKF